MKRKTIALLTLFTFFCFISSCKTQGSERYAEKTIRNFSVSKFHSIYFTLVGNIEFIQGQTTSVSIQGAPNTLKDIQATVKDGVLYLEYKAEAPKERNGKTDHTLIRISSPEIDKIELKGVGNCNIIGRLQTENLDINSSMVGNLNIPDLHCKRLKINSSSVGNINLTGEANEAIFNSSAVGDINAYQLKAKDTYVNSSAIGNVKCYASETIEIHSSAIGNVRYKGTPQKEKIDNHSIGKVQSSR